MSRPPFIGSPMCQDGVACKTCRTNAAFRQSLVERGAVDRRDFACPLGKEIVEGEQLPQPAVAPMETAIPRKRTCCGPKAPGLLQQAKSFTRALARETAARLKGDRALAKDVLARRAICKANECGQNVKGRCEACQCIIALKTAFLTEECPQGHWPALTRFDEREASAE